MDFTSCQRVREIIEENTKSDQVVISHEIVTEWKSLLKGNPTAIEVAFESLMRKLSHKHPQTRLLSLMLMHVVFLRSKHFRQHVINALDKFFELTLGVPAHCDISLNEHQSVCVANYPKTPPKTVQYLYEQTLDYLSEWNHKFGNRYYRLHIGITYLRNIHKIIVPKYQIKSEEEVHDTGKYAQWLKLEKQIKQWVKLIGLIKRKYPQMVSMLNNMQRMLDSLKPQFEELLQNQSNDHVSATLTTATTDIDKTAQMQDNVVPVHYGFSSSEDEDDADDKNEWQSSSYRTDHDTFGLSCLNNNYTLEITIDTNFETFSSHINHVLGKEGDTKEVDVHSKKQSLIPQLQYHRYLIETKGKHLMAKWKSILTQKLPFEEYKDNSTLQGDEKDDIKWGPFLTAKNSIVSQIEHLELQMNDKIAQCVALNINCQDIGNQSKNNKKHLQTLVNENDKELARPPIYKSVGISQQLKHGHIYGVRNGMRLPPHAVEKWKLTNLRKQNRAKLLHIVNHKNTKSAHMHPVTPIKAGMGCQFPNR
ncbi:hypothetical protein RFI_29666 [Reticulomyxa filosa]|uniref:Uncharacterized protein n=1 Tax=Reticulomyxa filosa TaxID=46433 RepID=X6M2R0_RETFI|nr:hypothetical protein RFI_29666 [Reticulomyxa filosa]|eukprot:ETO07727.1 hypothetical protein RFI_29666 [Reticulomyxa filosa]